MLPIPYMLNPMDYLTVNPLVNEMEIYTISELQNNHLYGFQKIDYLQDLYKYYQDLNVQILKNKISSFLSLDNNWNSYQAERFESNFIDENISFLELLSDNSIIPSSVYPTPESIVFEIIKDNNRNIVEYYADNSIVVVLRGEEDKYYDFELSDIKKITELLKSVN